MIHTLPTLSKEVYRWTFIQGHELLAVPQKCLTKKDVKIAFAKRDFATHFKDSVDYEDNTLVNGLPQKLVVSRSNSIAKEKKI